ncbi:MAG: PIG-L family deacetylase [Proteobacteria bacterium]|nr:PIG-L family deacetylase [Pseudomonadota bacterium]
MMANILVIAAHPDDEALGCGGTMARHSAMGDKVGVLFIADGVGARNDTFQENLIKRKKAAKNALKILNTEALDFLDFPDNRLDTIALLDIVQKIESTIHKFQPQTIYTHHYGDLNIDHSIVHKATMTACRPVPGCSVKNIYSYEVLSSTEWGLANKRFVPNYFIDIADYWDQKRDALMAYNEEMRAYPHTRSIESLEALSLHRGTSVGLRKAEAFSIIRSIND